jgi:hypothetical protein
MCGLYANEPSSANSRSLVRRFRSPAKRRLSGPSPHARGEPEPELIEQVIIVATAALVEERVALVSQALALVVKYGRHDKAGLQKGLRLSDRQLVNIIGKEHGNLTFRYIGIELLEPIPQPLVLLRVG